MFSPCSADAKRFASSRKAKIDRRREGNVFAVMKRSDTVESDNRITKVDLSILRKIAAPLEKSRSRDSYFVVTVVMRQNLC